MESLYGTLLGIEVPILGVAGWMQLLAIKISPLPYSTSLTPATWSLEGHFPLNTSDSHVCAMVKTCQNMLHGFWSPFFAIRQPLRLHMQYESP